MTQLNEYDQPIGEALEPRAIERPPHTLMGGHYCELLPLDFARDGAALHDAYAEAPDGRGWTYLPGGPFETADALGDYLAKIEATNDLLFFSIIDSVTGLPSGLASFLRIDPGSHSIEVGHIHFAHRLQRTPAATEAMYLMMKRAFDAGYRRYEWKCDSLNAPSRAAAKRLGFTYEGEFRQATHYKGRSRDTSWFSIIDTEWPQIRVEFERWLDPSNFDESGTQLTSLGNHH